MQSVPPPARAHLVATVALAPALACAAVLLATWWIPGDGAREWASRSMKINTALCLALLSGSALLRARAPGAAAHRLTEVLATAALAIGSLTLVQYATGLHFGIDELFGSDPRAVQFPNRMAPTTALLFVCGAIALLAPTHDRRWAVAAQAAALAVLAISLLAAVGFLYDATFLRKPTRFISMSVWTASASLPLAVGLLALQREYGVARLLGSDGPGGFLARRLLLPVVLLPALLGWLQVGSERSGMLPSTSAAALNAIASTLLLGLVVVSLARRLDRLDMKRQRAVEELRRAGELTAALARAATTDEVVSTTMQLALPGLGARSGAFLLPSADGQHLSTVASTGIPPELLRTYADLPLDRPLPVTNAIRTGTPVYLHDRAAYVATFAEVPESHLAAHESWAALPLHGRDRILGVLALSFAVPQPFAEEQRLRLERLADHCAQALERALLLESEQQARARAEAAMHEREVALRAKDEFLAVLGHELRNPLSPILTSLHLMERRAPDLLQKERSVIERQAQHMVRLVDDLLDVSRIARGKISLTLRRTELAPAIARAIEMASPLIEQRSHRLQVDVPEGIFLQSDEHRLTQIFANLLNNAARYSEPGGSISVAAERTDDRVRVTVVDLGSGIPTELLPHVFDLFVQGERRLERAAGGLGLGLALVKSLTELHGGSVHAASAGAGRGATFTVDLPVDLALSPQAAQPVHAPVHGLSRRVLVVDDNVDAADLFAEALRLAGHEVHVAEDGPRGLEIAARVRPEVAFLDLGLPVMDGYELAGRLRELLAPEAPLLVAVTGYGQPADRVRTAAAGFAHHLVKPIAIEQALALAVGQVERQIA